MKEIHHTNGLVQPLRAADIEALDQPIFDSEYVPNHFVRQQVATEVAHDLVNFDNDLPFVAGQELNGFNAWIDHRPLTCRITAHFIPPVNVAALHSICPDDVVVHCREYALHVAGVKPIVDAFEEFHLT